MTPLHVHTMYSQLDGLGSPDSYYRRAKELGFKSLAITDHGNFDGAIQFQKACKKHKLKSIIGCELYVVPDIKVKTKRENRYHLTCLVKNQNGWDNLCKMLSIANLKGYYYKPRVDFDILTEYSDGLIFLSGCGGGTRPDGIRTGTILNHEKGIEWFTNWPVPEENKFFLEVMPHDTEDQRRINTLCLFLNKKYPDIKLVATNDCHYVNKDDTKAHEVLLAIQTRAKLKDKKRFKFPVDGFHLRSEEEMDKMFKKQCVINSKKIREAIENTDLIAELCNFEIKKQKPSLPRIEGDLNRLCKKAYKHMFGYEISKNKAYWSRYKEEYKVVKNKKFDGYFLIVHDLIRHCTNEGIMCNVGRGSVGGSLIAYLLGITSVDPIVHDLNFSRFLTKDRIDFPDIDMDFEHNRRQEAIDYVKEKYGHENVAGISTFVRLKAKGVIRDVMRVYDFSPSQINEVSKDIEELSDLENNGFAEKYPEIYKIACTLEGTIKASGQHPAGVCISNEKINESNKCNIAMRKKITCVNWEMNDAEFMGYVKFDFLALKELSVLNYCKRLINKEG